MGYQVHKVNKTKANKGISSTFLNYNNLFKCFDKNKLHLYYHSKQKVK